MLFEKLSSESIFKKAALKKIPRSTHDTNGYNTYILLWVLHAVMLFEKPNFKVYF